jgi:electron transfer flavoprotein alpha subunit
MSNVYVVAEHQSGAIADVTFEMIGVGRSLAGELGGSVVAILLGSDTGSLTAQLGATDSVIAVDHPVLEHYNPDSYGRALASVVAAKEPGVVLIGSTSMGMDLAAGLSVDANLPLVAYASDVSATGGSLSVTSQLYGGKMNVTSSVDASACIVSVIAGSSDAEAGKQDGVPPVESMDAPADVSSSSVRFVRLIEPEAGDVDITQSEVLVSVGRGIQSDENIPMMEDLASRLGGALSASRPIIDSKWLPKTRQVGKSGLKVKPKLYLALGISGAPEHIEGMKDAETIIAVNTDPNAPIFDYAHFGVTEDLLDLVPALMEKIG